VSPEQPGQGRYRGTAGSGWCRLRDTRRTPLSPPHLALAGPRCSGPWQNPSRPGRPPHPVSDHRAGWARPIGTARGTVGVRSGHREDPIDQLQPSSGPVGHRVPASRAVTCLATVWWEPDSSPASAEVNDLLRSDASNVLMISSTGFTCAAPTAAGTWDRPAGSPVLCHSSCAWDTARPSGLRPARELFDERALETRTLEPSRNDPYHWPS
jgi:hypothetical protein